MPPSLDTTPPPPPPDLASGGALALRTPRGPSAWDFVWSEMVEWTEQTDGLLASVIRSPDARTVARASTSRRPRSTMRLVVTGSLSAGASTTSSSTTQSTTWKAAARVLGLSEDTLCERRKAVGDRSRPWWPSAEATRTWFEALKAAGPPGKPRRRPKTQPAGAAVDWDRVKL